MTRFHFDRDHDSEFGQRRYRLPPGIALLALFAVLVIGMLPPSPERVVVETAPPTIGIRGPAAATKGAVPAQASVASRVMEMTELDSWRHEAVLGASWAGVQLVGALLDNYERSHDQNDLFEAVVWMERGWSSGEYQVSGLATRVFERHCENKVLRWHWLCDLGE